MYGIVDTFHFLADDTEIYYGVGIVNIFDHFLNSYSYLQVNVYWKHIENQLL